MRTKWGQNFLQDSHWQKEILSCFQPQGDFAEIGPGRGALTQHLEKSYSSFDVFEIDPDLFSIHENKSYRLNRGNFLDWDFHLNGKPVENFSLIGNLPYESASHMIRKVIEHSDQIRHFVFLVQKEVAERVGAKLSTKAYSTLSILAQGQFEIRLAGVVPPGAFSPPPEVQSQVVVGHSRERAAHCRDPKYFEFVQKSFQQRRKQISNVWKDHKDTPVFDFLKENGIPSSSRAENIPLELWPKIYEVLKREQ